MALQICTTVKDGFTWTAFPEADKSLLGWAIELQVIYTFYFLLRTYDIMVSGDSEPAAEFVPRGDAE